MCNSAIKVVMAAWPSTPAYFAFPLLQEINSRGCDDKRGCTVMLSGSVAGGLLPMQVRFGPMQFC